MLATTGATTLLVVVAAFVGGWVLPSVRGMAFGGDIVVGTLGRVSGIFTAAGTIGGGTAMIDVIGTLVICSGGVGGVGGVGGTCPSGWPGIVRGSGGLDAMGWKPGGGTMSVAPSANIVAIWWRARRELSLMRARGLACDGYASALVRSVLAVMAWSTEDATGITRCVGNQARVSAIRLALVCHTQTR